MTALPTQMSKDDRKLTMLVSFSHFFTHSFMTMLPAVLAAIASEYSMSFMDIGIIANIGYFLYGLGSFPAGYLADKYGAKRILTICILGMSISSLLIGLAGGTITFAIAYGLLGTFASIHHPAGLALITSTVKLKGKSLGIHGVWGNVGLFFTPLTGAVCIMLFQTWRAAYITYALLGFCFFLILHFSTINNQPDLSFKKLLKRTNKKDDSSEAAQINCTASQSSTKEVLLPISLFLLYMGSIFSGFIFRGSLTFFPALFQQEINFISSHDDPVVIAGFVTTAILSLGLIGSWFGGYINDKLKRPELVPIVIFIIVGPALFLTSRLTDEPLLWAGGIFSLVYYAWQPSHNYLLSKYTPKQSLGKGFGVNFFLIFGVGSIATALGGYVADHYGVDYFYLIIAAVAIASLLAALAVLFMRTYKIRFSWKLERDN